MKKDMDFLKQDFEIPEVVEQKMKQAFDTIKMEKRIVLDYEKCRKKKKTMTFFKNKAAVIAGVCILAIGSMSAYAMYDYFGSRGMNKMLRSTAEQQNELIEKRAAIVFSEKENYEKMAVTSGKITVVPKVLVSSEKVVYLSMLVEGAELPEGKEPCFEVIDASVKNGIVNCAGTFCDGIFMADDGKNVYEDGSELKTDENGTVISYYTDKEGNMEYVMSIGVAESEENLLGETLSVTLKDFGMFDRTGYTELEEGEWKFTFELSETSLAEEIAMNTEVNGTDFILDKLKISPVSVVLNYSLKNETKQSPKIEDFPQFYGVKLKNGIKISTLGSGGLSGYLDDASDQAYQICGFTEVIDVKQIQSIILMVDGREVEIVFPK